MMISSFIFRSLYLAPLASAQTSGVFAIDEVGGFLGIPALTFGDMAVLVGTSIVFFVNAAAFLTIIVAGILAVVAQDEGRIAKSRKTVVMALMGIVLVNVSAFLAQGFMVAFDFDYAGSNPAGGASIVANEVYGFIRWIEVPVAIFAVITIIVYGIKAVVDYGGEQGRASFQKAIMAVMLGIILMSVKVFIAGAVIPGDPTGIVAFTGTDGVVLPAVKTLLAVVGIAALAAVVVIVIAGIIMVVSIGKEDQYTKAKGIIVRTLIGLFVIVVAAGLLALVIEGVLG